MIEIIFALSFVWFGWLLVCAIEYNQRINDEKV
jgi:hypothetical protein